MNFIMGRDGNISLLRVGVVATIVGILAIVGGLVFFFVDRASHQVPLDIDPFPGAAIWYKTDRSDVSRSVYYEISGSTAEDVVNYYQQKLNAFNGSSEEKCVRAPQAGNFPDFDNGVPDIAPYQFSCLFDRSGFEISQFTRVNIQPGIKSKTADMQGKVIVEYEQNWQR